LENYEFIQVALHEMGHVLGIGHSDSWQAKIVGGVFTGAAVVRSFGSAPPVQPGGGHFGSTGITSPSYGSFGRAHGVVRPASMLATLTDNNIDFDVTTDLDLTALVDIGWEIRPPLQLTPTALKPTSARSLGSLHRLSITKCSVAAISRHWLAAAPSLPEMVPSGRGAILRHWLPRPFTA
jgi:hypothetical protein